MQLAKNFTLAEFTASTKAKQLRLDNTPDEKALANLHKIAAVLQVIRDALGKPISVTSGYRSPKVNAAVGGSATSAHMKGLAADIKVNGMLAHDLASFINGLNLDLDQLILEYPDTPNQWVHVGLSEGKNRGQVLTKKTGKPYAKGLIP